jgi:16S rRNA processing protein RimM
MPADRWLRAGRVGRPHGLDGSFHVNQPTPQLLEAGAQVRIGTESRRITRRAGEDRRPIIAIEGCHDRDGAQALVGEELLVARTEAPELDADEWWAEELEGCAVRDGERAVGTVKRLMALPSVDILEVELQGGGENLLVPLVKDAVLSVDVERHEIQVDLRFLNQDHDPGR